MPYTYEELIKLQTSAMSGDSKAQLEFGMLFYRTTSAQEKALYWINEAVKNGNIDAILQLGVFYEDGKCGLEQNYEKATALYLKGAKNGNSQAQELLDFMIESGKIAGTEYRNVLEYYLSKEGTDQSHIQYLIGLCYEKGIGTDADFNKAMTYFRPLIANLDEKTIVHIAKYFYDEGQLEVAIKFYTTAANLYDNDTAEFALGRIFSGGAKEFQNEKKAFEYFTKSRTAKSELARCYYLGKGVNQDIPKAIDICKKAMNDGENETEYQYSILSNLQGRTIITISDIASLDIADIDESTVGAIQILPRQNEDIDSHTLYSIEDYKACVEIINNQILDDIEQNNGDNELEIFMKVCTKLARYITYDNSLEQEEKGGKYGDKRYTARNLIGRFM